MTSYSDLHQSRKRADSAPSETGWSDPEDLQPGKQASKEALFRDAYPWIVRQQARRVTDKAIREALSKQTLNLSPARFKDLCAEEARARNANGAPVCCGSCGAVLSKQVPVDDETRESNTPTDSAA